MRESANGGNAAQSSGAYGTRDSNQNFNNDGARQSAQTALGTHGMGALQGSGGMSNTTKIVGIRSQSKQDNMLNTRSSSVARLNNNGNGGQNGNIMASTQPRQVSNANKRGLPYVAS